MPGQSKRVRVLRYHVQPELVIDDGEHLTPYEVRPLTVAAAAWDDFVAEGLAASLALCEAQVNAEQADDAEVPPPA